ncbi:MAG: hypothetical protein K5694_03440 [Bacilli bacterium]|nr:hypothetical protein [Bacilli bacterium]
MNLLEELPASIYVGKTLSIYLEDESEVLWDKAKSMEYLETLGLVRFEKLSKMGMAEPKGTVIKVNDELGKSLEYSDEEYENFYREILHFSNIFNAFDNLDVVEGYKPLKDLVAEKNDPGCFTWKYYLPYLSIYAKAKYIGLELDGSTLSKIVINPTIRSFVGLDTNPIRHEDFYLALKGLYKMKGDLLTKTASLEHDMWIIRSISKLGYLESKKHLYVPFEELPLSEDPSLAVTYNNDIIKYDYFGVLCLNLYATKGGQNE